MKDVFVSFHTPDQAAAESIVKSLESNGLACFFAPRDMPGGSPFSEELVKELEACKVFLLVFSKETNNSKWVPLELQMAFDGAPNCLPVFIEECEPQKAFKLLLSPLHHINAFPESIETYFADITAAVKRLLPKEDEMVIPTTVFQYFPETGIMKNPADNFRNVSFRTDTFTNMMGGIFAEVAAITSEEKAQEIFFNTGYESGANFAERMSSAWGDSNDFDEIEKIIKEWCAFDSAVGWGKFEADIKFDEENETIVGTLTIIKAFIVDTRHKRKICSFIRGYCTGVLNTLLGGLGVELVCSSCPLEKKLSRKCVFDITMKG
ncbi:MAG: toll/interleukin-1 receptor domain-containing protein [Clostridia bacterium]|nr:toll/interleukin-1 receptor domain-containing protein [Clostridia bacterium]